MSFIRRIISFTQLKETYSLSLIKIILCVSYNHCFFVYFADETPKKQSAVTSFFTAPLKSERITQAIADMIVSDYVPLSIVEGEGFKNLMSIVAPDYTVPVGKQ